MTLQHAIRPQRRADGFPWIWLARLLVLALLVLIMFSLHSVLTSNGTGPLVQHITLMSPADAPSPPPSPAPTPRLDSQRAAVRQAPPAPVATENTPAPTAPAEPTGPRQVAEAARVAQEAEVGANSPGQVSKPAEEIASIGVGSATDQDLLQQRIGSRLARLNYADELKRDLEAILNRRDDLRGKAYRSVVDLQISPDGLITSAALVDPTGDAKVDDRLRVALTSSMVKPPPSGVRQPIRVAVASKMPSEFARLR
jgi:hypothetical protein